MNQEQQRKKLDQIFAKCWADEGFKQQLLTAPHETLKAEGLELSEGLTIKVHEDAADINHLVIPAHPTELSEEELDGVSGGWLTFHAYHGRTNTPAP